MSLFLLFFIPQIQCLQLIEEQQIYETQSNQNQQYLLQTPLSADCFLNTDGRIYNCPNTEICTSNYLFCPYISKNCPTQTPFMCNLSLTCTSNLSTDCCDGGGLWCPHSNLCVANKNDCCSINPATPIFCYETSTCVSYEYECCSNYISYPTEGPMEKCSHENKCVPADSPAYCFQPFDQACPNGYFQCPFDSKCVEKESQCASTRVCPPGYFTCPDYTCLPGLKQFPLCKDLPACYNNQIQYGRCSDMRTCESDLQNCPTQVTCPEGQVVCPDNSCAISQQYCIQIPSNQPPLLSSCGDDAVRCPSGECRKNCDTEPGSTNCTLLNLIQCPGTFECKSSYQACSNNIYCPLVANYTLSPDGILCPSGPEICAWGQQRCEKTNCQSQLNYFNLSSSIKPYSNYNPSQLSTCVDGRCQQFGCMTGVSCSNKFSIKSQIFGYLCFNKTNEADAYAQLAFQINSLKCPKNMITCLSGHCRLSVYDCPQYTQCPLSQPIQCQDGQCTNSLSQCEYIDSYTNNLRIVCTQQKKILCESDQKTCVSSVNDCPTMSTCPFGYIKCGENQCILQNSCPITTQCNSLLPYFCRSTGQCMNNLSQCQSMSICPIDYPVKCASDQSCQKQIDLCPQLTSTLAKIQLQSQIPSNPKLTCPLQGTYPCQNGKCEVQCQEWLACPQGQIQCSQGNCVSDQNLCPLQNNGCPFYFPYFCPYQGICVTQASLCTPEQQAYQQLNQTCQSTYASSFVGCKLGSCIKQNSTQQSASYVCEFKGQTNYQAQCANWQFPNDINSKTQCYVWQCPPSVPYKCLNGLCVKEENQCPVILYSAEQINRCNQLSKSTGANLRFPCADNTCVTDQSQCRPLYNCELNTNGLSKRCNDGSCVDTINKCPQSPYPGCTFRCSNGHCVEDESQCYQDNGCTQGFPIRCSNGACVDQESECWTTQSIIEQTSLNPIYANKNICEQKGLVTCRAGGLIYCAASDTKCIEIETGCPQTQPVVCGGKCVSTYSDCTSSFTANQLNNQGCLNNQPFRCSNLAAQRCLELPYTSDSNFYDQTCETLTQSLVGRYPINKCSSSFTPYSCADGKCVQDLSECKSCSYSCYQLMGCAASMEECIQYGLLKSNQQSQVYNQICPINTPIRCVLSGICVQTSSQCLAMLQTAFDFSFTGNQIDANCPTFATIRCIDGSCTNSYAKCISQSAALSQQFITPIQWGATQSVYSNTPCQVYCQDGSCRDRQENCPIALACYSSLKPYRCQNGICAQNQQACVELFGTSEEEPRGQPSTYCSELFGQSQIFIRCEDGTCRPATYLTDVQQYRTSCISYFGCSTIAPFQCPTGQCVSTASECLSYANTNLCDGLYMCKNLACVNDISLCHTNLSLLPVLRQEWHIDPYTDFSAHFIFKNALPVAKLTLKKGALLDGNRRTDNLLVQDSYIKVRINPVPHWQNYFTQVSSDAVSYTSQRLNLDGQQLDSYGALFTPIFNIQSEANLTLSGEATLSFIIDLPTSMNLTSDVCFAQAVGLNLTCITRQIIQQTSGWIDFPITELSGQFAVIFNPDMSMKPVIQPDDPVVPVEPTPIDKPDPVTDDNTNPIEPEKPVEPEVNVCDSIWCKYKWWIIGGASGLLVLIVLSLIICKYCCNKNDEKTEKTPYRPTQAPKPRQNAEYKPPQLNTINDDENDEFQIDLNDNKVRAIQDKLQAQFDQKLKEKDETIQKMQSDIYLLTQSPDYKSQQNNKLFSINADVVDEILSQAHGHYKSEVQRMAYDFQKDAESHGLTPPRKFIRHKKGLQGVRNFSPQDVDHSQYRTNDQQLSEQWAKLVQEYKPPRELLTQNSRPYLTNDSQRDQSYRSDTRKSPNSAKPNRLVPTFSEYDDNGYKPRKLFTQQSQVQQQERKNKRSGEYGSSGDYRSVPNQETYKPSSRRRKYN